MSSLSMVLSVARSAPAATARSLAMPCGGGDGVAAAQILEDLVELARHLGDRGAHGVGAVAVLDMDDLGDAGSFSGIRNAPPPTAISGTSPASVFMRSIASSAMRAASAKTFRQVARRDRRRFLSPSFSTPDGDRDVRRGELFAAERDASFSRR